MAEKDKALKIPAKGELVRTDFMAAFTQQFIGRQAINPFPAINQSDAAIAADFNTFISILITALMGGTLPRTGIGESLVDKVGEFLKAQKWPSDSPVAQQWDIDQKTLHLIEISVIADGLLKAISNPLLIVHPAPGYGWPPH